MELNRTFLRNSKRQTEDFSEEKIGFDNKWEIKRLGDITEKIIGGGTPSRSIDSYWGNDIPWATVKDLSTFDPNRTQEYITSLGLKSSASNLIPAGTLITSTRMALGKAVIYSVNVAINQDLKALFIKQNNSTLFLFYWFEYISNSIVGIGNGSTVKGISIAELENLPFPNITFPEQCAIAEALSDVDVLIESLDRLIAKKRDIKQAAMQQLLTGKKRLPGFEGEWEIKKLGIICEMITKGTTPTTLGKSFKESGVIFLKAESISENGELIPNKLAYIDAETHKLLKRSQLKAGDLLFSIAGVLGRVGQVKKENLPANTNQALAIIRTGKLCTIENGFLFYFLCSPMVTKQINDVNVQAAQANLSLQNVYDLEIYVPPTIHEQTAIVTILSDMDSEITILENRLEKTRALKQAMMQELLTGKTRLV